MPKEYVNYLRQKLESGVAVLGTWCVIPSTVVADIAASAGLDFVIIDTEHGPITFETAQCMAMACESRRVSPVMRVGGVIAADILRALDIGVHCVQVPNIICLKELAQAVTHSKYPPIGQRGFSPFTRAGGYSHEQAKELTKRANERTMLCIHIEGREAVDSLDELLKVHELDIVFIGMFDLSKSIGIPGQVDHPDVLRLVEMLTIKILKAGKYPGTIVTNGVQLQRFINMGMKYITYSVDCEMLYKSYAEAAASFSRLSLRN